MKLRKPLIVLAVAAVLVIASCVIWRWPISKMEPGQADQLSVLADHWCEQRMHDHIPEAEWPAEIRALSPTSVFVMPEGVYIERGSFCVEAWGIFVLRTGTPFQPKQAGDPSYRHIRDRVYWFEIKG